MKLIPDAEKAQKTLAMIPEASYFHDIGKVRIPEEYRILADIRTDAGKDVYRTHVDEGFKLFDETVDLSALPKDAAEFMSLILNCVLEHHERYDGKGFPNGLSGEEIDLAARITAVSDQLDNYLTTTRDKEKISLELAIDKLQTHKNSRFDPNIVNACVFAKPEIEDKLFLLEHGSLTEVQNNTEGKRPMELVFRPVFDTLTRQISQYEAVLRLYDKTYGTIYPAVFVPVAEKNDLIKEITEWSFKELGKSYRNFIKRKVAFEKIYIQVSSKYLSKKYSADSLLKILDDFQVNPTKIAVELSESIIAGLKIQVLDSVNALRRRGVSVTLYNFGSEYSSLSKLSDFETNSLILSKDYTDQIVDSIKEREVVRAIVGLAKSLQMEVLVDGVQTKSEEQVMKELGIRNMMGDFYGTYKADRYIRGDSVLKVGEV